MELDNIDAAKKMVQEGFGVALIPLHGRRGRARRRPPLPGRDRGCRAAPAPDRRRPPPRPQRRRRRRRVVPRHASRDAAGAQPVLARASSRGRATSTAQSSGPRSAPVSARRRARRSPPTALSSRTIAFAASLSRSSGAASRSSRKRSSVSGEAVSPRRRSGGELLGDRARLDQVARAAERRAEAAAQRRRGRRAPRPRGAPSASTARRRRRASSKWTSPRGKVELLEVRAYGLRRDAQLAQAGDGRGPLALRELAAVVTDQQAVVDVLGRLGPERAGDRLLELRARQEVLAADDVRDAEVEVVDDRGELVRRPPVGADERGALEAQGALGVRRPDLAARPPGAARPARSAAPAPRPSRSRATRGRGGSPPRSRAPRAATSVSSIRRTSAPSRSSAKRRLATAVSAPPRCSDPVGLGAKRTLTTRMLELLAVLATSQPALTGGWGLPVESTGVYASRSSRTFNATWSSGRAVVGAVDLVRGDRHVGQGDLEEVHRRLDRGFDGTVRTAVLMCCPGRTGKPEER